MSLSLTTIMIAGCGIGTDTTVPSQDVGSPRIGKYNYMPIEAIQVRKPGENEHTGKFYYTHVFAPDIWTSVDDGKITHVDAWVNHVDNLENYDRLALIGINSAHDWDLEGDGGVNGFLVFFEYIGYSDELGLAYGIYEKHEIAQPFFDPYAS